MLGLGATVKMPELPKDIWTWCSIARTVVEGKVRSFDMMPMWEEVYKNPSHNLMIMGGRQIGKSTFDSDKLAHAATTIVGSTSFYVTDSERHLSEYSTHKFRRGCLDQNELLKVYIRNKIGKVSEVNYKNNSVTYLGTDEGHFAQVESTSPTLIICDQAEYLELQYLSILYESMSRTQGRIIINGVGGEAGGPLENEWLSTDQRHWHYEHEDWYDRIRWNNDTPARCINTSIEIKEILRGQWIAKKPENYLYPGYYMPQSIFPHIPRTIEDATRKYHTAPRFSLEWKERNYPKSIWLTHVMGTFYHAQRRPITRQMVEACMIPYGQYYLMNGSEVRELKQIYGNEIRILAGIDFGSGPSNSSTVVAIVIKWKKSERYQLAWIEKRPQENLDDQSEYLTNLLEEYAIDLGVGDLGYGAQQVKHIQDGHVNRTTLRPYNGLGANRFMGCRTIGDEAKPQQQYLDKVDEHGEETGRLQIDKTTSIQLFCDFLEWYANYIPGFQQPMKEENKRPRLMIPYGNPLHVEWLINDWIQTTRKDMKQIEDVDEVDPRQKARKEFNHPKDSMMAMIYVLTADAQEEGGFDVHGVGSIR